MLRALLSPPVSFCFWVPALIRQSGAANSSSPSIVSPSSSDISSRPSSTPFNYVFSCPSIFRFLLFHLCTMLPASQACRRRLDHSLSLPAENWTCFVEADPHVHCVHTVIHVQLDHWSVSNVSKERSLHFIFQRFKTQATWLRIEQRHLTCAGTSVTKTKGKINK